MTIKQKKERVGKIEIDLTGPEGNAFVLMGYAKSVCRKLGIDFKPILNEMRESDYTHLLEVFEREFGDYFILYTDSADSIKKEIVERQVNNLLPKILDEI